MPDYHVAAWNWVDRYGKPIIEIDQYMTIAEYDAMDQGSYAAMSITLLRPISREAIDWALTAQD